MRLLVLLSVICFLGGACSKKKDTGHQAKPVAPDTLKHQPPYFTLDSLVASQPLPPQPRSYHLIHDTDSVTLDNYHLTFKPASSSFLPYYEDHTARDSVQRNYADPVEQSRALEAYLITQWNEKYTRSGDTLSLILEGRKEFKLVNSQLQRYFLEHCFDELGYSLIKIYYRIGSSYLLVEDHRPVSYAIWGRPYFSPQGDQLVVINDDLIEQYGANGIQYFLVDQDRLKLQWELGISNWGPTEARWKDPNSLVLRKEFLVPTESDEVYMYNELALRWVLKDSLLP